MRFENNRRGVEIMVKFLGMTTRQAVGRYAATFVARSKAGLRGSTSVTPASIPHSVRGGNWAPMIARFLRALVILFLAVAAYYWLVP